VSVATMNIKDPEVRRLALELAQRRGVSMTEAVRQAVNEALRHDRQNDDDYVERGIRLADAVRMASTEPILTDDDLYDERGLPT
jgi:antitoxin VapB